MVRVATNFLQVEVKVCLQLFHVKLEVAHLRQLVHLLDEEHSVVLGGCHEQIIICEPH